MSATRMAMWNADGSRAEMCGNGLRCLAALAHSSGHVTTRRFTIETDSGPRACELLDDGRVRTAMGDVRCSSEAEIEVLLAEATAALDHLPDVHGSRAALAALQKMSVMLSCLSATA